MAMSLLLLLTPAAIELVLCETAITPCVVQKSKKRRGQTIRGAGLKGRYF